MIRKAALLLLFATTTSGYFCPNVCECLDKVIMCKCTKRENVTVYPFLNFAVKRVAIHSCGSVSVLIGALMHLGLDSFEIHDANRLEIHSFGLSGAEYISSLRFSSIANLDINPLGFSGLSNMTEIIFSNVTVHSLARIGQISHVEKLLIENSTFVTVETLGAILGDLELFEVRNTYFGKLENASLLIHDVGSMRVTNSTFASTMDHSFVLISIQTLNFTNCIFGNLASFCILGKEIHKMIIHKSRFNVTSPYALQGAEVLNKFVLSENRFGVVGEKSLFPNVTKDLMLYVQDNVFDCNCQLSWMWTSAEDHENSLVETSFCVGDDDVSLASLSPEFNSKGQCVRIDFTFPQEGVNTAKRFDGLISAASENVMEHETWMSYFNVGVFCLTTLFRFLE